MSSSKYLFCKSQGLLVVLVSEYLHMLEDRKYMPKGAVTFATLTPNAINESAVSGTYFVSTYPPYSSPQMLSSTYFCSTSKH